MIGRLGRGAGDEGLGRWPADNETDLPSRAVDQDAFAVGITGHHPQQDLPGHTTIESGTEVAKGRFGIGIGKWPWTSVTMGRLARAQVVASNRLFRFNV